MEKTKLKVITGAKKRVKNEGKKVEIWMTHTPIPMQREL